MKHLFFLLAFTFVTLCSFAGEEWTSYFNNNQIEILYRYADCHDDINGIHQQKILLKYVNKSDKKVEITFARQAQFTGSNTSASENNCIVILQAMQAKEAQCTDKEKAFVIFSKHLNMAGRSLKSFDLKNISVKIID